MNGSGHLLKLFSLSVLALGLMAFSASAAQAEGTWMVATGNLEKTSENKSIEGGLVNSEGALSTAFGKNAFTFECTGGTLLNANLEPGGAISEASKNAKVDFSGCKTFVNGKESTACVPVDGATKGVILSEEGYALLTLHELAGGEKDGVTLIVPKTGNVFAVIRLAAGCAFGEEVKVFGSLAVKDVGNNMGLELEALTHTIEEFAPLTSLKALNKFAQEGAVILDGEAEVKLVSDQNWSGLP
jgi:hypothetical protein